VACWVTAASFLVLSISMFLVMAEIKQGAIIT
jgi:hypothetical protein